MQFGSAIIMTFAILVELSLTIQVTIKTNEYILFEIRKQKNESTAFFISNIAILTVTPPIVINVLTSGLLAVETKDSFILWLADLFVNSEYRY